MRSWKNYARIILATCGTLVLLCGIATAMPEITLDAAKGILSVKAPGISIHDMRPSVSLYVGKSEQSLDWTPEGKPEIVRQTRSTPLGSANEESLTWTHPEGFALTWKLTRLATKPGFTLRASLKNGSNQPLRLRGFLLGRTPEGGMRCEGKAEDWMLHSSLANRRFGTLAQELPAEAVLIKGGAADHYSMFAERKDPRTNDPKWRGFRDDATLYTDGGNTGLLIAAVGDVCDLYIDYRVEGTKLTLDLFASMNEVLVDAGESRESDEALFLFEPWAKAHEAKGDWLTKTCGARTGRGSIFGWLSWYRSRPSEKSIGQLCDAITAQRQRLPFQVILIDEYWQKGRHDWRANEYFPGGMDVTANRIKEAGMIPGIWMCPIDASSRRLVNGKVEEFNISRGEVLRVFPPEWYDGFTKFGEQNKNKGKLDPTVPAMQDYLRREIGRLVGQGYRYFKFDFTEVSRPAEYNRRHDPKMTRFQAQRLLFKLYREIIGEDSYLVTCTCKPTRQALGYADSVRIGTDTGASGGFARRPLAADGNPANVHGFWFPMVSMTATSVDNGRLLAADPDVTYAGKIGKCTQRQLRTWHGAIGLLGGLLMLPEHYNEPEFDTPEMVRMAEILHPFAPEKGRPFAGGTDIWGKEFGFVAKRPYGNFVAINIWNPEHEKAADLGIAHVPTEEIGQRFHVWSFWDEKYLGVHGRDYLARNVAPYEGQLLRLTPLGKSGEPVLVGSTFHVTMGAAEIGDIETGEGQMKITLKTDAGAMEGKLYIQSERPLALGAVGNCRATVALAGPGLYAVVVCDRKAGEPQTIKVRVAQSEPPSLAELAKKPEWAEAVARSGFPKS